MVVAGKPHAPRNCSLWNQTADSVEVSCVAAFDGGLPQRFLLEVYADSNVPRYQTFNHSLLTVTSINFRYNAESGMF